ncbi:MAG: hypothetical protein IPH93_05995 [Saprospiraceae bacterium]|nr:hypothetical protein [Saprospiraceae bacterium]
MLKSPQNKCIVCQAPLVGRRDKRFCTDSCRSIHHQQSKKDLPPIVKSINQILKHNREIMTDLNPDGKRTLSKDSLLRKGFDFRYFTHLIQTKTGNTYYFCYDQGYIIFDDGKVLLVKQEEKTN